jgi:hypothetical protein
MVTVIDTNSMIRRVAFHALLAAGESIEVFYSPESFVSSNAILRTDMLILGYTRTRLFKCEAVHCAAGLRPNLTTLLLNCEMVQACRLLDLCNKVKAAYSDDDASSRLDALCRLLYFDPIKLAKDHPEGFWGTAKSLSSRFSLLPN